MEIQMRYYPDSWIVIKIPACVHKHDDKPMYKIIAGWAGSYLAGESWRINSGITKIKEYVDKYEVTGYSGSIYTCYKDCEKESDIISSIVNDDRIKKGSDVVLMSSIKDKF